MARVRKREERIKVQSRERFNVTEMKLERIPALSSLRQRLPQADSRTGGVFSFPKKWNAKLASADKPIEGCTTLLLLRLLRDVTKTPTRGGAFV